jgi:hypothetical protein
MSGLEFRQIKIKVREITPSLNTVTYKNDNLIEMKSMKNIFAKQYKALSRWFQVSCRNQITFF